MGSNKSILFVINVLTRGGAEVQVLRMARGLQSRGWHVTVVSMIEPEALTEPLPKAASMCSAWVCNRGSRTQWRSCD